MSYDLHRWINKKWLEGGNVKYVYCGIREAEAEGKEYTDAWIYEHHRRFSDNYSSPFQTGWLHQHRIDRLKRITKQLNLFA